MLHIFLGEDDYSQEQAILRLQKTLGPQDMASLNTERLDTQGLNPNDLAARCAQAPFLAAGRLIVVRGLFSTFEQAEGGTSRRKNSPDVLKWKALADFAPQMPPSTTLVLQDDTVKAANPLLKLLSPVAKVQSFAPLRGTELLHWVQDRVKQEKGHIASDAAQKLTDTVGGNLWVMSGEVEKLLLYCQDRPITLEDVDKLSGYAKEEQIFALADAFFERKYPQARRLFARVMEGSTGRSYILFIFGMHIRRLIQTKDIQETTRDPKAVRIAVEAVLRPQSWLADRVLRQAGLYTMDSLIALHGKLLDTDLAIKAGRLTEGEALELLLAEALNRPVRAGGR